MAKRGKEEGEKEKEEKEGRERGKKREMGKLNTHTILTSRSMTIAFPMQEALVHTHQQSNTQICDL